MGILLGLWGFRNLMNAILRPLRPFATAIVLIGLSYSANAAQLLGQWDFNLADPTNNVQVGTTQPSSGTGTAALVGGATATFATGSPNDPATVDDSGWNTSTYPAQGTGNKTRGVQFNVSTHGFQQVMVTWDQRHSSTANRYIRFQYSSNGTDFIDGPILMNTTQDSYFPKAVDLTSFGAVVNNKSNFAFRIVSEFESTATGSGAAQYVATATGGTYSPNGTWRFDMVTVTGEIFTGNEFPTITQVPNQTNRIGVTSQELPFTIGDFETAAENLILTAESSNEAIIANFDIVVSGTASNRTIRYTAGAAGNVTITLSVTDEHGQTTRTSFAVTVLPDNTPPVISSFTNYHTYVNTPLGPIAFLVGDAESAAGDLTLSAVSSNPEVIADAEITFGGSGSNRTVSVSPVPAVSGNAVITVTVTDPGGLMASRQFAVMILPSASVVLCDSFTYGDGPLNANSGFRWAHHSGIAGQTKVIGGEVQLTGGQTEDISATLIGAPYATSSGKTLYASFTVNYKSLPPGSGEFFAHFRDPAGALRARVFGTQTNVTEFGRYRLGIANESNIAGAATFPVDLTVDTEYVVVVRYDLAAGISTLWVNPVSEGDTSVVAPDAPEPGAVLSWAFRQSNVASGGIGTLHVDDVKVGFAFKDVQPGYRLAIGRNGSMMEISWAAAATDEGFFLYGATDLTAGNWQLTEAPERVGTRDRIVVTPSETTFYRLVK